MSTAATGSLLPQKRQLPQPLLGQIKLACASIGSILSATDKKYAIVGGAACHLLGSPRVTDDVDIVVPTGQVSTTRKLLAAHKDRFTVQPRTLHTHFNGIPPILIEILAPPGTFREKFDQDTPTVMVELEGGCSVSILHPVRILNAKCRSILGRATEERKKSDAHDIKFLLGYLADSERFFPTSEDVPNASEEFVAWFSANYGDGDVWNKAIKRST